VKGLFITFEGPDGAGKTTQVRLLADALAALGKTVVLTREPGGTRIGDQIRRLLLAPDHTEMDARTEVLLYAAQRAQNVAERIVPALAQGNIVIGDRFTDASMAYQSAGLGIDEAFVRQVNEFATVGLKPHRTYMLDLPEDAGRRRLENRIRQAPDGHDGLDRIVARTTITGACAKRSVPSPGGNRSGCCCSMPSSRPKFWRASSWKIACGSWKLRAGRIPRDLPPERPG